ncbi:MAG: hypothetical protein WCG94_04820 [Methanothrix sp.]
MLSEFKYFTLFVLAVMAVFSMTAFVIADTAQSLDWNSYSPAHAVGSGDGDWWTTYPDQHENSGSQATHPDWVMEALKEKPVLILIHSSNCVPCLKQMPRIESTVQSFGEDLLYSDVLAEESGYEKAIAILDFYDPVGGKSYVPTTIFITLAKGPNEAVEIAWHSEVDAMSQERIDDYVKDSIYYYKQNRAAWK